MVGLPTVLTVKLNAFPEVAVAVAALVKVGTGLVPTAALTVSAIVCAAVPPALVAVIATRSRSRP